MVAALGQPSTGTHGAVFEFLVKRQVSKYEKAELRRIEGERLFEEKQYEAAMSVLIDAGNSDPVNMHDRLQALFSLGCVAQCHVRYAPGEPRGGRELPPGS